MSATDALTEGQHEPGRYEIRLKGHLDARWAVRFEGLSFTHANDGTTILAGPVVDQAALYGLLRTVRDLGLPLLSVVHIGLEQANGPDGNADSDHKNKETPNEHQDPHPLDRSGSDGGRDYFRVHSADPST